MAGKRTDSSSQSCAACKYKKVKCNEKCLLSPYFPRSRTQDFLDVQDLFGLRSINRILKKIEPEKRSKAVNSMVLESKARKLNPVNGIVGFVHKLEAQIRFVQYEIDIVKQQIAYCQQGENSICSKQKEQIEQLLRQQQKQQEQIDQLLKNQQFLCSELLASSSSAINAPPLSNQFDNYHYQIPALPDPANIEPHTRGDNMKELNQVGSHSSTPEECEDTEPFSIQTAGKFHNSFKDAGEPSVDWNCNPGKIDYDQFPMKSSAMWPRISCI